MAALATGGDGLRAHLVAELDHGDEAVAAGAVPLLRPGVWARSEGGERAPAEEVKPTGMLGAGVVEGLNDIAGEALEAIDVAPGRLPGSEVGCESVGGGRERLQQLVRGSSGDDSSVEPAPFGVAAGALRTSSPQKTASDVGTESRPSEGPTCGEGAIWSASLAFRGSEAGSLVPGLEEGGKGLLEPRQIAVVGGRDQGVEGEILLVLAGRGWRAVRARIRRRFRRRRDSPPSSGCSVPAADHGQLLALYSQPLDGFSRCGVSSTVRSPFHSVAGLLPSTGLVQSKLGIAAGDEVAVEVGDVAVGVGEDRVVRGVRLQFHGLPERLVVVGLGARDRTA